MEGKMEGNGTRWLGAQSSAAVGAVLVSDLSILRGTIDRADRLAQTFFLQDGAAPRHG